MLEVDAIILAAGLSRRMGSNKLLLPLLGTCVLDHFLRGFPHGLFHEVILVAADEDVIAIGRKYPITLCTIGGGRGKSYSIQEGVRTSCGKDGMMFFVSDQPMLRAKTIGSLLDAYECHPETIVVPRVEGRNSNPVIFPHRFRKELLELQGDEGGRKVLQDHQNDSTHVECGHVEEFSDIDTPEHYRGVLERCRKEQ